MERERISITLRKGLLTKVDNTIDGVSIRNRSHAIEYHLSKVLSPRIDKAVILAGGPGTDMRPFTYEIPKGLIPIHGKPLLEYSLELLKKNHITNIVMSIGHLGDKIREHFGSGERFGVNIKYNQQNDYVGTGGALALLKDEMDSDTFVVMHGDILVELDLEDMINFHQTHEHDASLALTSAPDTSPFGVVQVKRSQIVSFLEKPKKGQSNSNLINAGVYIFDNSIFEFIPAKKKSSLEEDVFPKLTKKKQLGAYIFDGAWIDVGTPQAYEEALQKWQ